MQLKIERFEWLPVAQCHRRSTLDENRSVVLKIWSARTLRSFCMVSKQCSIDILSNFECHLSYFCLFLYPKWVNKHILKCLSEWSSVWYTCILFWIYRDPVFSQRPTKLRIFFVSSIILVSDHYLFCITLLSKLRCTQICLQDSPWDSERVSHPKLCNTVTPFPTFIAT